MAIKKCYAVFHYDPVKVGSAGSAYTVLKPADGIQTLWYDEGDALHEAHDTASKHPGTICILLEAKCTVEAKKPDTVHKAWKNGGELIPIEKPEGVENEDDAVTRQLRAARNLEREQRRAARVLAEGGGGGLRINVGDFGRPADAAPQPFIRWDEAVPQPQVGQAEEQAADAPRIRPQPPLRRG